MYTFFIIHHAIMTDIMNNLLNAKSNMNNDFEQNFEYVYKLSESSFSHSELLNMLKDGNIQQKQIAALKFDSINNTEDAYALLSNLTGCDGKIREAVANKLNYLLIHNPEAASILPSIAGNIFADATIDINANICRLIVDSAAILKDYEEFAVQYTSKILDYTKEALDALDKFIFKDKKYMINKQLFKLYWCLEAICIFKENIDSDELNKILLKCANQSEYTIREKVAKIIASDKNFYQLRKTLENDGNYYVREALYH